MHRALHIDEVVQIICRYTYKQGHGNLQLANLARVDKGFGGVALDLLWRDVPMFALLYLFPVTSVTFDWTGRRVSVQPVGSDDWSRFVTYSPRIRAIHKGDYHRDEQVIDFKAFVDFLVSCSPGTLILPSLQTIRWNDTISRIPDLSPFITRNTKNIVIKVSNRFGNIGRSEEYTIARIVSSLFDSSRLEGLHLNVLGQGLLPRWLEQRIDSLYHQCRYLTDVAVVPSRYLLCTLATLPTLRFLSLISVKSDVIESSDVPALSGIPFPALEIFRARVLSLHVLSALVHGVKLFPQRKIIITCETACTADEFSTFLEMVTDETRSINLTEFSFFYKEDEEVDQPPSYECQITLDHLHRLLSLHNMEIFSFCNLYLLDLDDGDILVLASAWPKLMNLVLCPLTGSYEDDFHSRITLYGLITLSGCENLEIISLGFRVPALRRFGSFQNMEPSNSPVKSLHVGNTFITSDCARAVAEFLIDCFPKLEKLDVYSDTPSIALEDNHRRWGMVDKFMDILRA